MKRLFGSTCLVLTLLSGTSAQATVVYNWVTTAPHPLVTSVTGRIEVTEQAWLAGSMQNFGQSATSSAGGLISLHINVLSPLGGGDLIVRGGGCATPTPEALEFCSGPWATPFYDYGEYGSWSYALMFNPDGTLGIDAASDAGLTFVRAIGNAVDYEKDYGAGGPELPCQILACRTEGYWQLDLATVPVPEPGSALLFGFGIAAFAANWARSSRSMSARM